jgi:hypothetical protein
MYIFPATALTTFFCFCHSFKRKMISSAIVYFLIFLNASLCQNLKKNAGIELKLNRLLSGDDLFLKVTVFKGNTKVLYFTPSRLKCYVTIRDKLTRPFEEKVSVKFKEISHDELLATSTFELQAVKEGTVQCVYSLNKQTVFWSNALNTVFTNVQKYAIGVLSDSKLNSNELSKMINAGKNFKINATKYGNTDYFTFSVFLRMTSAEADSAVLRLIQNMLVQVPPENLRVNFTRSTRFCQPIKSLNITHTRVGYRTNHGELCDGNIYIGAYWNNETLQQIIRADIDGSKISTQLKETNLSSIDSIENFARGLNRVGAVNTLELAVIASKCDQLVADKSGVLRDTNFRQRLNTGKKLLTGMDSVFANVPLPAGSVQVDAANFAFRVENARDSGNNGFLFDEKHSHVMTPIEFEKKNDFVVKSNPR